VANSRYYSSTAVETTLTGAINNSVTSISVASTTGFPGSLPYTLALDYGSASNELVEVTAVGGLTLTVTRGIDGTSATSHGAGAVVRHVSSARDFTDSRTHEASNTGVHGVSGVIVDTLSPQTLQNKTLTLATGSLQNVDIFNDGAWSTAVIGETPNDGVTRFHVLDDEVSLNELWAIGATGNMVSKIQSYDTDGTYRIRVIAVDGTTDRFAMLSGGTIAVAANGTTTQPVVDIKPGDTSTTKRAIRVAANGGGAERFTVWNDGKVEIFGQNPAREPLSVQGAAGQSVELFRVRNSTPTTVAAVTSAGVLTGYRTIDARTDNAGTNVPLTVHAVPSPGTQSANLTNWVDESGAVIASVDPDGHASFVYNEQTTGVTPSAGWSVTTQRYREVSGVRYINIGLTRTGADIVVPANGNVTPDLQIATVPAAWTPVDPTPVNASNGINSGTVRPNTDSTIDLTDWTPSQNISTGTILRFNYTVIK
jgi:hypothetical protein